MSSKLSALATALAVLASVGCTGVFVPKTQYDRDVNQLREYVAALERDNAQLRPYKENHDRLKAQADLTGESNKTWEELARALKKALDGIAVDPGDYTYDPKSNSYTFAESLLFDLGSFQISAKGKEVLKKFAELNRGARLRVVGHTDHKPVVRASTKKDLDTDSNPELSVKRAVAVMGALMANGLRESQFVSIEGKGYSEPRGNDKSSRRVEIFIVGGTLAGDAVKSNAATPPKAAFKTVNK